MIKDVGHHLIEDFIQCETIKLLISIDRLDFFRRKRPTQLACLLLVRVNYLTDRMTIPFGDYQPSDEPSSQLFTPRLRLWLDERLRYLVSQQKIQDARALRGEFSIEELTTR